MFILILLLISASRAKDLDSYITYLHQYGYLEVESSEMFQLNENNTKYTTTLEIYQQTYGLPVDGKLNTATVQLMKRLRCGVPDYILQQRRTQKWLNNAVTWKFHNANERQIILTKRAFDVWSKHANINFIQTTNVIRILHSHLVEEYTMIIP